MRQTHQAWRRNKTGGTSRSGREAKVNQHGGKSSSSFSVEISKHTRRGECRLASQFFFLLLIFSQCGGVFKVAAEATPDGTRIKQQQLRKFTKADYTVLGDSMEDEDEAQDDAYWSRTLRSAARREQQIKAVGDFQPYVSLDDRLEDTMDSISLSTDNFQRETAPPTLIVSQNPTTEKPASTDPPVTNRLASPATSPPSVSPVPTVDPTPLPTEIPTLMPSMGPSASPAPSDAPSSGPTISAQPSSAPSDAPSSGPTTSAQPSSVPTASAQPSWAPTQVPSALPTLVTSDVPSTLPSASPSRSVAPSGLPTSSPTLTLSDGPSAVPSSPPSISPTSPPSAEPSVLPSAPPTLSPSAKPSAPPSASPTSSPSAEPSAPPTASPAPSAYPSLSPSDSPSAQPTFSPSSPPTYECHDLASYKSPINGLGCDQHRISISCENWKLIGLTDEQVMQLHNECPVTCKTDCVPYTMSPSAAPSAMPTAPPTNPLVDIVAFIEFYVHSVPGEIEGPTRDTFENGMFEYFSEVIDNYDTTSTTDMRALTLADQGVVGTSNHPLMRSLRSSSAATRLHGKLVFSAGIGRGMLADSVNLKVKVIVEATSRALDDAMLQAVLLASLRDGSDFAEFLAEDPFFDEATFSTTLSSDNIRPQEETEPKPPTAAIVVSTIGVIAIFGFMTGHYFFRHRYDKYRRGGAFFTFSPKASIDGDEGLGDPDLKATGSHSIFSFEESPMHRSGPGQNLVFASLLGSRSNSHGTKSASDSSSQASLPRAMEHDQKLILSPPNSPENLLAGIPPMIVIDNIEQNHEEYGESPQTRDDQSTVTRDDSGMPIRRIEASSSLAKALASNKEKNSRLTLMDMLTSVKSNEEDDTRPYEVASPASRSLSPVAKRNDSDSVSVASTPGAFSPELSNRKRVHSHDALDLERSHRKCHSQDALDDIEPSDALDELIRSEWTKLGLDSSATKKPAENSVEKDQQIQAKRPTELDSDSRESDNDEARDTISSPRPSFFIKSRFKMTKFSRKTDDRDTNEDQLDHEGQSAPPILDLSKCSTSNISSISVSPMDKEGSAHASNSSSRASSSPRTRMRKLSLSPKPRQITKSQSSLKRSSSEGDDEKSASEGFQYTFEAPSSGKLGIIIHKTVVHTVKDYSPLFGMIEPGDKIIQIDDIETDNMSTGEITKILASKRTGRTKSSGVIRMTVSSLYEKTLFTSNGQRREMPPIEMPVLDEKKEKKCDTPKAQSLALRQESGAEPEAEAEPQPERRQEPQPQPEGAVAEEVQESHSGSSGSSFQISNSEYGYESEEDTGTHLLGATVLSPSGEDQYSEDDDGFHLMAGAKSEDTDCSLEHLQFMADHIPK